ncbi:MAG: NAD-dependent epimerase/dehydratase family protein [Thermoplasmatota archaeon]
MKILVTGSSGYVGMVLSRYFSEKGIPVTGIDVRENHAWKGNENFDFIECDVTDRDAVRSVFRRIEPTHVIHLAYLMTPLHDKKKEYDIDVNGTINVYEESKDCKSVIQFIEMSSTSAYGGWPDNPLWIKEDHPLRPRGYRYGINKREIEEYMAYHPPGKDMKLIIFRMCTAVGPSYHKKGGVVAILAKSPLIIKFSNRYAEVQFIHEDDLTAVFDLILNDPGIEGIFNLAPDSYSTTRDLSKARISIPVPLFIMKGLTAILWSLHLSTMRPPAVELSTYGIVADPRKLMERYDYEFRYGTKEAYFETVKERKKRGTL